MRARRPEHKQQRREAILEAARDLALRRGVRAITLGDLADAVGLAKSNVVRYFGTREEIFVELCSEEGLRLRDALLPRLAEVTEETLPRVLASTLMDHELFCELLSQLTTHLEHNVSYPAAERLKVSSTVVVDELAKAVAARPVGLDVDQATLLLTATSLIGAGLWSASRPSDVVLEVYAAHPEIVPTRVGARHSRAPRRRSGGGSASGTAGARGRRPAAYGEGMTTVPTVNLNTPTGTVPIPQLGFGVWQVSEDEVVPSVAKALEVGYRHIDTAAMYGNERGVGHAIQDSGLGDNVWVTTKLNNDAHGFDAAMKAFDVSMDKLRRETLDLYLIHWPLPSKDRYAEAWKAMQALRDDGRITTIGVCNFQVPHLQKLYEQTGEYPAINQIELHPYLVQQELRDFHAENGIVTEAWSPLASGGLGLLNDLTVTEIARAHDVTPAQAILRWHLQLGNVVIPKSVTPSRIDENFDLFGFELTDDEVDRITALDRSKRTGPHPDRFNPGS